MPTITPISGSLNIQSAPATFTVVHIDVIFDFAEGVSVIFNFLGAGATTIFDTITGTIEYDTASGSNTVLEVPSSQALIVQEDNLIFPILTSNIYVNKTAELNISKYKVVKFTDQDSIGYASVSNLGDIDKVLGVAYNFSLANQLVTVQTRGELQNDAWSWTFGDPIYLGLNGELVDTPPVSTFQKQIGVAIASDKIYIDLQPSLETPGGIDLTRVASAIYILSGGEVTIATGLSMGSIEIPFNCSITGVTMLADQVGSISLDIWKTSYSNYPPDSNDSICGGEYPTITASDKSLDTSLDAWDVDLLAGDILMFNVRSAVTVKRLTLSLTLRKSF